MTPQEIERMISFGPSLTQIFEEQSRYLEGVIDAGEEEAELVISFGKVQGNLTTTLQETAILLSVQAESLKMFFEFKSGEFIAKVDLGKFSEGFSVVDCSSQYIVKFILRRLNHQILYEYRVLLQCSKSHPHGEIYFSKDTLINHLNKNKPTIRLYAPTIMPRDAIGNYCKNTSKLLTAKGYNVQIYADNYDLFDFGEIKKCSELFRDIQKNDILIVNYSIFDPQFLKLKKLLNTKILIFQNVTPAYFFEKWDLWTSVVCSASRDQFAEIEDYDEVFVNSLFSGLTLQSHFRNPKKLKIIPPFYRWQYHELPSDKSKDTLNTNLLFVGRLVANKCIDDLVKMFFEYLKFDNKATLTIVGGDWSIEYRKYLDDLVCKLGFYAEQLIFAGSVSDSELHFHYQQATAYVCMSEHEGYCLPIVEAMMAQVPIFAYFQPAVVELLAGSGVIISDKNYLNWAKVISSTLNDDLAVKLLVDKQSVRLKELLSDAEGIQLIECLQSLNL